jgi:hypothetical protein
MGNNTDETQRTVSDVPIPMRLTGGDVESDTWPHLLLSFQRMHHALPFQDKDLVLVGVLMRLEDGPGLKLNHSHGEVRRALRLADEPADRLVFANRLLGNIAIISAQHVYLQN